jgi:hypothetical protein
LLETPALTLGFLTRQLLGDLAGAGFFRQLLLTQALFLGLARSLGLQPAAFGGEPLLLGLAFGGESRLLGLPRLPGGLFPGKLLGALALEALALGALRGFLPGLGLPLSFRGHAAALALADVTAQQVATAVGLDLFRAVLLVHLALRIHRRHVDSILRSATAGREGEGEGDGDGNVLVHDSPFRVRRRAAPELFELT